MIHKLFPYESAVFLASQSDPPLVSKDGKCHHNVAQAKMEVTNAMHKCHIKFFHLLYTACGCI